jgi:hypothetical protein
MIEDLKILANQRDFPLPIAAQSVSGGAAGCREAIKTRWVDLVLG